MRNPKNRLKAALAERRHQLGIWNGIGGNTVPEVLGGAGFDWVLIDCEHAPIGVAEVLPALQAIGQHPEVSAAVRPATLDAADIKRILDMGAQTLLIPYVETAQEAEAAVAATRYGPRGIRGMAGMTRATRYGQVDDYFVTAADELCLILQIETVTGLANLEAIAKTPGVDAIFLGPADLSASMGLPGQMDHPEVIGAMEDAVARCRAIEAPIGMMCLDVEQAKRWIAQGSALTAVGVDLVLLTDAIAGLRAKF